LLYYLEYFQLKNHSFTQQCIQMSKQLILYSTSHCHLCELALSLVMKLPEDIEVALIDIADNETLLVEYGLRIPVLQRKDTLVELDWPFSEIEVHEFLN
jgi:hypothetical protein